MSEKNMRLWDSLYQTDPKYTKRFKRSGGFEGTSQNPTYVIMKLTEEFGPCGEGWGLRQPKFDFVPTNEGMILVYCTVEGWYVKEGGMHSVFGVGGDSAVGKNKYGLNADDEAAKKAFTDAFTNAFKFIGVGADLYLGMYDDSKYVNDLKSKFGEDKPTTSDAKGKTPSLAPYDKTGNKDTDNAWKSAINLVNNCISEEAVKDVVPMEVERLTDLGATDDQIEVLKQQGRNKILNLRQKG